MAGEGQEQADAVDVGEVEDQVGGDGDHGNQESGKPAYRLFTEPANHGHGEQCHDGQGDQGVGDIAVTLDIGCGSEEGADDVGIRGVGGDYHNGSAARCGVLASGACEEESDERVGQVVQAERVTPEG